jgi:hypothetical protein
MKEVQILIITGALRLLADYYMFNFLGFTAKEAKDKEMTAHDLTPFFFGSVFGVAIIGPIYDFIFAKSPFIVIMIIGSL